MNIESLNNLNLFFILAGIIAVGFGVIGYFIFSMQKKWNALFGPSENNKELVSHLVAFADESHKTQNDHEARLKILEAISHVSIQKVGFIRFNPFPEMGGDNSFSMTFLDRDNNGVILSSLYMRDGVRVYGKSVVKGEPKHPLSKEEMASLHQAIEQK